jgi:hypothetical protein
MQFSFKKKEPTPDMRKGLSREYIEFLLEEQQQREVRNWYEKLCKFSESLKIKPSKSMEEKSKLDIVFSGLNVTPTGVLSASIFSLIFLTILMSAFFFIYSEITKLFIKDATTDTSTLAFLLVIPLISFWYIYTFPSFRANVVRVQAGDESIKVILYMAIYLKLNPSFEGAVNFACTHSKGPITEDIKKAMWDLQIGKYRTVEQALGTYTSKWVWWNEDFVRSISLLYGVLIEPSEAGREAILRKALSFILDTTHQKMKKYVEDVSSPIMMLHVMGLLLPAIGLIMFPMVSIFLHQGVSVPQLILGYVVVLPAFNLFFINRILQKRPGAFMVPDISKHPELPPEGFFVAKLGKAKIYVPILILSILVGVLTMTYGLLHFAELTTNLYNPPIDIVDRLGCQVGSNPIECILLDEAKMSPKNLVATFSITAGAALAVILYFYLNSFQRIKIRNDIKNIESEFQIGLFSLGNFLSEGYPIEVGILKSLEEYKKLGMEKRPMYGFFLRLYESMKNFGTTFKKALFDKEEGLLKYYPSVLIDEIMKILADASEKSAILLGSISKTIASYLENVYAIEAKIRELLEETRSSIRLQASFVIPMVTGMVGALGIFILNMLRILAEKLAEIEKTLGISILSESGSAATTFINYLVGDFTKVVPMTVLQATIGIYTVEVVALFAMLLSGIENGFDKTARDWEISQTLIKAILIYGVVNVFALIVFNTLTATINATG